MSWNGLNGIGRVSENLYQTRTSTQRCALAPCALLGGLVIDEQSTGTSPSFVTGDVPHVGSAPSWTHTRKYGMPWHSPAVNCVFGRSLASVQDPATAALWIPP